MGNNASFRGDLENDPFGPVSSPRKASSRRPSLKGSRVLPGGNDNGEIIGELDSRRNSERFSINTPIDRISSNLFLRFHEDKFHRIEGLPINYQKFIFKYLTQTHLTSFSSIKEFDNTNPEQQQQLKSNELKTIQDCLIKILRQRFESVEGNDPLFADYHICIDEDDMINKAQLLTQLKTRDTAALWNLSSELNTPDSPNALTSTTSNKNNNNNSNQLLNVDFSKDLLLLCYWVLFIHSEEGKEAFNQPMKLMDRNISSWNFFNMESPGSEKLRKFFKPSSRPGSFIVPATTGNSPATSNSHLNPDDNKNNNNNNNNTEENTVMTAAMSLSDLFTGNKEPTPRRSFIRPNSSNNNNQMNNSNTNSPQLPSTINNSGITVPATAPVTPINQCVAKLTKRDYERMTSICNQFDRASSFVSSSSQENEFISYLLHGDWLSKNHFLTLMNELPFPLAILQVNSNPVNTNAAANPAGINNSNSTDNHSNTLNDSQQYSFLFANQSFEMVTKYSYEELYSTNFPSSFVHSDYTEDEQLEKLQYSLQYGFSLKLAIVMKKKSSRSFFYNFLSMIPIFSRLTGNYKYILLSFYDISNDRASLRDLKYIEEIMLVLTMILQAC